MSVSAREITWNEFLDRIREQSEHIHETDAEERRLIDPLMLLMDIREMPGCYPTDENRHVFAWLEEHGLISDESTNGYVCIRQGVALADYLIEKEDAYERQQRRDHMDDHLRPPTLHE